MQKNEYLTVWFESAIAAHSEVSATTALPSGHVRVERKRHEKISVAPVSMPRLDAATVEAILEDGPATVICLVPTDSHYDWDAREKALQADSSVHTMKELMASLSHADPRPFRNSEIAYVSACLKQHRRVRQLRMLCEASMELTRNGLENLVISIEHQYEFSEEALVRALKHHPDAHAVVNSNPNGKPTEAALRRAQEVGVGLFSLSGIMGALNYEGTVFLNYRPPG